MSDTVLTPERRAELRTKREVCWSKDHPELLALLDAADEVAKLLADRCPKCGMGPMTRIDGGAKYCSNCINLACAQEEANGLNMWKGWADESEAECSDLRDEVAKLRAALADLLGPEPEYSDKFPTEKKAWQVLAATTPKEPAK